MAGEHLERLKKAMALADSGSLEKSYLAWKSGFDALDALVVTLTAVAPKVEEGFSDGLEPSELGTARAGRAAFDTMRTEVVEPRRAEMKAAAEALVGVKTKLKAAEDEARAEQDGTNPATDPGAPPKEPDWGSLTPLEALAALNDYISDSGAYTKESKAFGERDERARKLLVDLDGSYATAIPVFEKIHGEPVYPEDVPPGPGSGPGEVPAPSSPVGRPPGLPPGHPDAHPPVSPPVLPPRPPVVVELPGPHPEVNPVDPEGPGTITTPVTPIGGPVPGGGSGGGFGVNPLVGGGLAAGVLGGPGLVNAVRGALGGRGASGSSGATIGSTTRKGGSGTLGRSGALAPGSQAGRGTGGRGAGARGAGGRGTGGGRGVPGTAGGRGNSGGRGGGAVGGGTSGRRKDDEQRGNDRDLFDDGNDWIDDEGSGPGVLG